MEEYFAIKDKATDKAISDFEVKIWAIHPDTDILIGGKGWCFIISKIEQVVRVQDCCTFSFETFDDPDIDNIIKTEFRRVAPEQVSHNDAMWDKYGSLIKLTVALEVANA